jgi:hypothetical protein
VTQSSSIENGSTVAITYLSGTPASKIIFPAGSLPTTCTIAFLTRHSGATSLRVLVAGTDLFGHWNSGRGIVFNTDFKTEPTSSGTVTDWTNMVVTNSLSIALPKNVLLGGSPMGSRGNGGTGNQVLSINMTTENSDFQFSQLIIWDQTLTVAEMTAVATALNTYLSTGNLQ